MGRPPSTAKLADGLRERIEDWLEGRTDADSLSPMDVQKLTDGLHKLWRIEKESQDMIPMTAVDSLILAVGKSIRGAILDEDAPQEPGLLLARIGKAVNDAQAAWSAGLKK